MSANLTKISSPPKLIDDSDNSESDESDTDHTSAPSNMNPRLKKSTINNLEAKFRDKQQKIMHKNNIYKSPSRKLSLDGSSSKVIKFNSPSSGNWKVFDNDNSSSTETSKRRLNFDSTLQKKIGIRNINRCFSQSPNHFENLNIDLLKPSTIKLRSSEQNIENVATTQVDFNMPSMSCSPDVNDDLKNILINLTHSIKNIKYDMKNCMIKIDRIENMLTDIRTNQNKYSSDEVGYLVNQSIYKFPMTNIDELNIFEEKLEDIEFRQKVIHFLRRLERDSISDMTRQIMSKMFHNNLLSQFSYAGQKHKMVFSTLHRTAPSYLKL